MNDDGEPPRTGSSVTAPGRIRRVDGALLGLVTLAAIVIVLWAVATPPWRAPDEPSHFSYIEQLVRDRTLPLWKKSLLFTDVEVSIGRTNFAGITGATSTPINVAAPSPDTSAQHPPLYYLLMSPVYALFHGASTETQLYAIRIAGAIIFAALIAVCYRFARLIFPRQRYLQLGVPLLVILHPQLGFISAGVMNDGLETLLFTLFLYQLVRFARGDFSRKRGIYLGIIAGLGMLTKSSFVLAFPCAAAVAGVLLFTRKTERKQLLKSAGLALGIAIVICSWWYIRNYVELGTFQPTMVGERYHTTSWWYLWKSTTFRFDLIASFIGNFSWLTIQLPAEVVHFFNRTIETSLIGVVAALIIARFRSGWSLIKPWLAGLFAGVLALFFLAGTYYELTVAGTQGRYLFPAIFPFWTLVLSGLVGWMPPRLRPRATALIVLAAGLFFSWALFHEFLGRVT